MTAATPRQRLPLVQLADMLDCDPAPTEDQRAALRKISIYNVGYGSVARPMDDRLAEFGVEEFTLADPKRYRDESVLSQCESDEVGLCKVEAGLRRLGAKARIAAFPTDVFELPDGLVGENTIVVSSVDNRRADIGANRLATRMRARFVKVNIETAYDYIAIRCYDFRTRPALCAECQYSERMYSQQRHPRSCDEVRQRHTAAPRWLSQTAGDAAALVIAQLADAATAARWLGRQWQLSLSAGEAGFSELSPSPRCRWKHDGHWPNLLRRPGGPETVSLKDLLNEADMPIDSKTCVQFCQQVATAACCESCLAHLNGVWWLSELRRPLGTCAKCGGVLLAVPYWMYRQIHADGLASVIDRPLAEWGVPASAVIALVRGRRKRSYVIGNNQANGFPKSNREIQDL